MTWAEPATAGWSDGWTPRIPLTVSGWAERERLLPEASAARGARWRNDAAPYLAGIQDSLLEPGVRKIAVMKSAQAGVTESLLNVVGYHVAHDPCPMLFVAATYSDAEKLSKGRLADMIRTTPVLRSAVHDRRLPTRGEGRSESTVLLKQFPGGFLALAGANSSNTFAALSARLAFGDDVARWPMLDEGDPADLLANRVRTYHDGRVVYVSTPTVAGDRIETLFRRSDQRRFFLRCPGCKRTDWASWNDHEHFWVGYEGGESATARLVCPRCESRHDEPARRAMVAAGEWRATRKADEPGLVGFHLPGQVSTLGVTLADLVAGWLAAQGRREALRAFVNTSLAESWEELDTSISLEPAGGFMSMRETYETIPAAASLVTGAMDVQDDRFELLFVAWGPRDESWVLEHFVLRRDDPELERRFDPYDRKDWERLYLALFGEPGLRFEHASGAQVPVSTLCVDSGFLTPQAYGFTRFNRRVIYATKGVRELQDGHLIKFSEDRETAVRLRRPVHLVLVNTAGGKQRLADRIADGRVHFPVADWCDPEFFEQLTSERAEPIFNPRGVRVGQKWVKTRPRNEVLDLLVLNLAAREIRGTWDLEQYRRKVGIP